MAMDIADGAEKGDAIIEKDDLKVFLEKKAEELLSDATMDYVAERGFVVTGMRQTSCCG